MADVFAGLLFLMIAAHALCETALQPPGMSSAKAGRDPNLPWPQALAAHSLIHGLAVALITGFWQLGLAETLAHAAIDRAKARQRIGAAADQLLHLLCKVIWALLAILFLAGRAG